ncbi:hypothetical protein [Hyphomonas jannaschiana]|uniref:hypothetical protein n=1 Tax=Hyphomonas jannaschiana TaxID=86 RepID=UPI0035C666DA
MTENQNSIISQLSGHFSSEAVGLEVAALALGRLEWAIKFYKPVQWGEYVAALRSLANDLKKLNEDQRYYFYGSWDRVLEKAQDRMHAQLIETGIRISSKRTRNILSNFLYIGTQFELLTEAADEALTEARKEAQGRPRDLRLSAVCSESVKAYTCLNLLAGRTLLTSLPTARNGGFRWCEDAVSYYASQLVRAGSTQSRLIRGALVDYRHWLKSSFETTGFDSIDSKSFDGLFILFDFFGGEGLARLGIENPMAASDFDSVDFTPLLSRWPMQKKYLGVDTANRVSVAGPYDPDDPLRQVLWPDKK